MNLLYHHLTVAGIAFCYLFIFSFTKSSGKQLKKAQQLLATTVIKLIVIAVGCTILLAVIAERLWHYYKHVNK